MFFQILGVSKYNDDRGHSALDDRTEDEVYYGPPSVRPGSLMSDLFLTSGYSLTHPSTYYRTMS